MQQRPSETPVPNSDLSPGDPIWVATDRMERAEVLAVVGRDGIAAAFADVAHLPLTPSTQEHSTHMEKLRRSYVDVRRVTPDGELRELTDAEIMGIEMEAAGYTWVSYRFLDREGTGLARFVWLNRCNWPSESEEKP